MPLLLNESGIDRVVGRCGFYMLAGLLLFAAPPVFARGWELPLTGFAVFYLGIVGSWFRKWRTEPGLWMLAAFLTVLLGVAWASFEIDAIVSLLKPPEDDIVFRRKPAWQDFKFAADCALSLWIFGGVVRFVASVVVASRRWTSGISLLDEQLLAAETQGLRREDEHIS